MNFVHSHQCFMENLDAMSDLPGWIIFKL